MEAWAQVYRPDRVQALFDYFMMQQRIVLPNLVNYNTLLWAWARSKKNRDRVDVLFEELKQAGLTPDEITYHAVLFNMLRISVSEEQRMSLDQVSQAEDFFRQVPTKNAEHYTTLMTAYSRCNRPDKVESLFHEFRKQEVLHFGQNQPTLPMYVTRLQAWAKAKNPSRATSALESMILAYDDESNILDTPPGTSAFNAVLSAWMRSNRPEAADRAEQVLVAMTEAGHAYSCLPDTISFTTVIIIHARSYAPDAGKRAWILWNALKEMARESPKDKTRQPNLTTYTEVILALLRSTQHVEDDCNRDEATSRAKQLLVEMQSSRSLFGNGGCGQDAKTKPQPVSDLLLRIGEEITMFGERDPTRADELMQEFRAVEALVRSFHY
jgi:pentatricopeptide repeat protein